MSALLTLVPWWGRWLALAGFAAALIGWGYVHGFLHEERKLDIYQAQVDVIAKEAAKRAAERRAAQDNTTKEIRDAYKSDAAAIRAYYARRLRDAQATRSRGVSAAADGPARADGAAGECAPGDEGDESGISLMELEERAAFDAAKLLRWQEWARKNEIPVR